MALQLQAKHFLLACLLILALIQTSKAGGGIATYWGQNLYEGSLAEACNTGLYSYINIAFLITFGGGQDLGLNLAGHCDPTWNTCTKFGAEIKTCQSLGVKLFLSIGGASGTYNLTSAEDAKRVAEQIWNSYLGGTDSSATRPFGDAVLDGVDFDIEVGSVLYYDSLAAYLKNYSQQGKTVYLSAAPQCPYPDAYLGTAIDTGLFDFVWVQFYNNRDCMYTAEAGVGPLLTSWNTWSSSLKSGKLFMGLPATEVAAPSGGYIPPEVLINQVLPVIVKSSNYGGVMLWSRYYDFLSGYSSKIISYLNMLKNPLWSIISMFK
ncbi:acidic endochitinase-like [Ziziphus jujuba]|uniref:chitinase n=1 Tax=Ziziphus jujuba TaxID=326968 RepID=A0ABM4AF44_ZIZJJ|nr:acidic endochitinase-like [Ziziphus jujuba]